MDIAVGRRINIRDDILLSQRSKRGVHPPIPPELKWSLNSKTRISAKLRLRDRDRDTNLC